MYTIGKKQNRIYVNVSGQDHRTIDDAVTELRDYQSIAQSLANLWGDTASDEYTILKDGKPVPKVRQTL
jgi:hypothetical protein